jgi:hypothetical protein
VAIRLESTTRRFIGLSTDPRPVSGAQADGAIAAEIPVGSSLLLTDTWEIERWDGTAWRHSARSEEIAERLDAQLAVMREIKDLLEGFFHSL